jgi:hypothetical protein
VLLSELFGVVSALRRNASQTEVATNMSAIHKQNKIFTTIVGATVRAEGMNIPPLAIHAVPNGEKAVEALVI